MWSFWEIGINTHKENIKIIRQLCLVDADRIVSHVGLIGFSKSGDSSHGYRFNYFSFFNHCCQAYRCIHNLIPFRIQQRSRWFISWVGLRGAVPIVFATYPLIAGAEKANMIFNIVFFISVTSVLIQGTTLPLVAKWLHRTLPEKLKQRTQIDLELYDSIKSKLTERSYPKIVR
ncbi:MAG: cation:proton antiporter [Cyclobacteriaceae bacterium]|nr:cation:proton antiporter [Cyclobacteriaceae bacterium]